MNESSGGEWTKTYTVVLVVFGIIAVIGSFKFEDYVFNPVTMESVKSLLIPLFIIAVFLERAQEVFISAGRDLGRKPKDTTLKEARVELAAAKATLAEAKAAAQKRIEDARSSLKKAEPKADTKPLEAELDAAMEARDEISDHGAIAEAQKKVDAAAGDVANYKGKTKRNSFLFGLGAGLAISIVGVRVLKPFVSWDADPVGLQAAMFDFIDIALTGAMIGGGSDGIHKIMNVITEFLDVARDNRSASRVAEGVPQ